MDKFSYAIGLGIGQNLLSMGAQGINVNDFAQAIKDVLDGKETAISHNEAREIVNKYFEELEAKMNAANIETVPKRQPSEHPDLCRSLLYKGQTQVHFCPVFRQQYCTGATHCRTR